LQAHLILQLALLTRKRLPAQMDRHLALLVFLVLVVLLAFNMPQ
jgi:hypothetical protein